MEAIVYLVSNYRIILNVATDGNIHLETVSQFYADKLSVNTETDQFCCTPVARIPHKVSLSKFNMSTIFNIQVSDV